jgi:hypothetical protein
VTVVGGRGRCHELQALSVGVAGVVESPTRSSLRAARPTRTVVDRRCADGDGNFVVIAGRGRDPAPVFVGVPRWELRSGPSNEKPPWLGLQLEGLHYTQTGVIQQK